MEIYLTAKFQMLEATCFWFQNRIKKGKISNGYRKRSWRGLVSVTFQLNNILIAAVHTILSWD